ncbi:MAG: TolC family protein, partial [Acidobacteriota bacterium]
EDPATFRVVFTRGERLTINMATARAIGVFPRWKVMTEAELIHQARAEAGRRLTLADAVREAAEVNLDLAVRERAVAAGAQEVNGARSTLLPQMEVSGLGAVIDGDLGSPQLAERSVSGSARISQVIFSERAWANLQIQGRLQASRESERDQVRLDIIQEAATAYLNVLRAKTFERIQKDNVRVSRSNLELARVRQAIGFSGPGEVYRWESRIATDQKSAIAANSQRNLAEMALNRAVHRPLEDPFETVEIGLDDARLMKGQKRLSPYIDNPWNFRIFRRFMVEEGLAVSPELKRLDAAVAAQERALSSARRTFFSPTVAAQGELTNTFFRGGVGADPPPIGGDLNWNVGVNVSLPLFSGGGRYATQRKAREELEGLRLERQSAAERIEQRIRSAIHVFGASNAGIQLSVDAAEAARRNLELTTDAYSRGVVSVLDMLDARNAALASEQAAANAVYDCLIDWMEVQRAAGRYTIFMDDREVDAFFDRLDAFLARPDLAPEGR